MDKFTNILLAEDDISDYHFFVEALAKISPSFKVTHAKNGLDCMAILKGESKPDIIFLDLNMPGFNGKDCLKYIKTNERLAEIPTVIYSTSHYIKDIDSCYKSEASYYIVKPSNGDHLVNILRQVFSNLNERIEQPAKENFVVGVLAPVEK